MIRGLNHINLSVRSLEESFRRAGPLPEYTHVAFDVGAADFRAIADKIKAAGATIFKDNKSEGDSLYFLDPNGHKLEVHVGDWKSRLAGYRGRTDMEFYEG